MQSEIDKYSLIDLGKTDISKTKMKFDAKGIIDRIELMLPQIGAEISSTNLEPKMSPTIDLNSVVESAVMNSGLGLSNLKEIKKAKGQKLQDNGVVVYDE